MKQFLQSFHIRSMAFVLLLGVPTLGWAQTPVPSGEQTDQNHAVHQTVSNKYVRNPEAAQKGDETERQNPDASQAASEEDAQKFDATAATGVAAQGPGTLQEGEEPTQEMSKKELQIWRMAALLKIPYRLLRDGVHGFELIYSRHYADAEAIFARLDAEYPESAVAPFGRVFMSQARMAENLDFAFEDDYKAAFDETIRRTKHALKEDDSPAWNHFVRGTVLGMNSFYLYRKDKVLAAVKDGWTAISDIEDSAELEPNFVDPILGLGLYNYWRSAVTLRFKELPGFPDRREEGIRQMEMARDQGVFAPPLALLALAFTYYEERDYEEARKVSQALADEYPENIINLQILGNIQTRQRHSRLARATYLKVLEIDPQNTQVHYYLGKLYFYRLRNLEEACRSFTIVANARPGTYYGEMSRVRLGDACWLLGKKPEAEEHWRIALEQAPDLKAAQYRAKGSRPSQAKRRFRVARGQVVNTPLAPLGPSITKSHEGGKAVKTIQGGTTVQGEKQTVQEDKKQ